MKICIFVYECIRAYTDVYLYMQINFNWKICIKLYIYIYICICKCIYTSVHTFFIYGCIHT